MLRRFGLACVVINRDFEVLHFAGSTEDYLAQPGGPPTQNLLSLARQGLESKLRVLLHRATRDNALHSIKDVKVRHGDDIRRVHIAAEPLNASKKYDGLLLISFREQANSAVKTLPEARTRAATAESSGETLAEAQTRADRAESDPLCQLELELENRLFNLIDTDRGRPIGDLVTRVTDGDLRHEAEQVLRITFVDITERKLAADKVVLRLAAVVESSADAIFSKALDGTIRTWNRGAERLYGYSRAEAVGRSVKMLVPEDRTDGWTRSSRRPRA